MGRGGKNWVMALAASQLGLMVAAGLLGGLWLDRSMGTSPLWGIIGLIGGFGSGIVFLVRLVRAGRQDES